MNAARRLRRYENRAKARSLRKQLGVTRAQHNENLAKQRAEEAQYRKAEGHANDRKNWIQL